MCFAVNACARVCPCLCICICLCDIPERVQIDNCLWMWSKTGMSHSTASIQHISVITQITQNSSLPLQTWQPMQFGDAPTRAMEIKLTGKPWWRHITCRLITVFLEKKSLIISLEGNNGLRFQHTLCQALMWKLQTHACPQDGEKELYKLSGTAHFVYLFRW